MSEKRKHQAPKVCLFIPAYNEATAIESVIKSLHRTFKPSGIEYQIVVVDDGSRDTTGDIARKNKAHVIFHILNTGVGGATATGLSYARTHGFTIAATLDGDGQHAAKDVLNGVLLLQEHEIDLLIGSRMLTKVGMSKVKQLGNWGLSLITYILFGVNVTDSQSGLRIFSEKALQDLRWRTDGYEVCSEMIWRARQLGLQLGEFPIQAIYTDYSRSKGQNNWNAFNIIKSLLRRRIVEFIGE